MALGTLLNTSRPRRPTEVAAVAAIQAQAFHKPSAFAPLDTLLYYTFQVRRSKPFGNLVPHSGGGQGRPVESSALHKASAA